MSEQTAQLQGFAVSIFEPDGMAGTLVITFVPTGLMQERGWDGAPKQVPQRPQFIVAAHEEADRIVFDWSRSPDDPGALLDKLQKDAAARVHARRKWVESVNELVNQVETWASELEWSTRRVEKKLDDGRIGRHRVPGLLMQADTCRILLEPVGRSTPGTEGVVDLYLMPAYDDIATLYYYGNRWNLHYAYGGNPAVATVREAPAIPLSKEALRRVLAEMKQNAA